MPVTVSYALNAKSLSLNLFYAVMEDGIRSVQANNLGAVSDPDLGEWGQGGKYSSTTVAGYTHNDVVRATLSSYKGIGGYASSKHGSWKRIHSNNFRHQTA